MRLKMSIIWDGCEDVGRRNGVTYVSVRIHLAESRMSQTLM